VASFIWGTIGFALFAYGKKGGRNIPLAHGLDFDGLVLFSAWSWLTVAAVVLLASIGCG